MGADFLLADTVSQADYAALKRTITQLGLLKAQNGYYVRKTIAAAIIVAVPVVVAVIASNPLILLLDAVLLGFAFTQIALLAHDVGHRQGYRGRRTNRIARLVFGNLLLGVSHTWWNTKHNQHHATPNHIDKDPDVKFPMFAFSEEQILTRTRFMRPMVAIQAFVFPTLLPLQAINMRITSVRYLFHRGVSKPLLQAAMIGAHFALYGILLWQVGSWPIALLFFGISQGTFGLYNSSVFASNHKGMTVINDGSRLDFLREQVLTARDVKGHPLTDFWYGGLNYQIEHHLFPTMPRNNLKKAQTTIRAFCADLGVPHLTTGPFEAYGQGFAHLHRVGASLRRRRISVQ